MEKIKLKGSDLIVSRLCIGGCPMGQYGWGAVSKDELIAAVREAIEIGVNFFDTADTYGLGTSEKTLAEAIGARRNDVVIATKFGVRVENGKTFYDNSSEWIRTACENSLRRLKTDYIDLYQIHYRDSETPIEYVVETLETLKKEGKIRYYGLSNTYAKDIAELEKSNGRFVSIQDEYSLACRKNEKDLIECSNKLNLTPLTWGSLGQGILTGKYNKDSTFGDNDRRSRDLYVNFHGDKLIKNLSIVETLREIAKMVNKSIPSIAIRWILDYLNDSVVITGIKNTVQLRSNVEALDWKLNDEYIELLNKKSL